MNKGKSTASPAARAIVAEIADLSTRASFASDRAQLYRESYRAWRSGKIAPLSQEQRGYRAAVLDQIGASERDLSDIGLQIVALTRKYVAAHGRQMTTDLDDALSSFAIEAVRVGAHAGQVRDGLGGN